MPENFAILLTEPRCLGIRARQGVTYTSGFAEADRYQVGPLWAKMRGGTLTLLMMDVAERKKLLAFMPATLQRATDFLCRSADLLCDKYGGNLYSCLDHEEAVLVVFDYPSAALEMVSELYRELRAQAWYPSRPICRAAVVTGEVSIEGESLKGHALRTLSAILDLARPGQILVGEGTHFLARHSLRDGNGFLSLGFNHVDDGQRGQTIYQLLHPELPYHFQPLASMLTAASNLPRGNTPFIGRRQEIETIREGFYHAKVVSLFGFDGVGKTRLATEVAFEMLEDHYHGACYVDLVNAETEAQIYREVAVAMGVLPHLNDSTGSAVIDRLRNSEMLLVLDNIQTSRQNGAQVISRILDMCPRIQVLNTSNRFQSLPFMFAYPVHPMAIPSSRPYSSLEELSQVDSVALFVNRAAIIDERFQLTPENATDIVAVCRKLDGIPLAIELAAARLSELDISMIARRLEDRFGLLVRGRRTGRSTLEACLQVSYEWLSDAEQKLLNRLVVFGSPFTIEGAKSVAAWDPLQEEDIEPLLAELAMQGFVGKKIGGKAVYIEILDTIRDFCRPFAIDEINQLMDRHAEWYADDACLLVREMDGPSQADVALRIDLTYENYILALNWLFDAPGDDRAVEILILLHRYWLLRCLYSEGYHWSETILNQRPDLAAELRGRIHFIAGVLGGLCGAYEKAEKHFRDAESIAKKENLRDLLLASCRASGDNLLYTGNLNAAAAAQRKSLDMALNLGGDLEIADCSLGLAEVLTDLGKHDAAEPLVWTSLEVNLNHKRASREARCRLCLARSYRLRARDDDAIEQLEMSLRLQIETADNRGITEVLREFVFIRLKAASYHSAATILGAEETFRRTHQVPIATNRRAEVEKLVQSLKQELGNHYRSEFEKGAQMSLVEVREFLLLNSS